MLKTLFGQVKQYKTSALLAPVWTSAEVVMGVLIPYVTASLIDKGINAGNMAGVYKYGGIMLVMAFSAAAAEAPSPTAVPSLPFWFESLLALDPPLFPFSLFPFSPD